MARTCPVCEKQTVTMINVIAAAFGSDSRCSNCGSAVRFSNNTQGAFVVCALLGFAAGYFVNNFVIGGIVALILCVALLGSPLKADETDSVAVKGLFRKAVDERKHQDEE